MEKLSQKETLHRWIENHSGILYKVVRSYARSHHDQEDLFQEVVTQVWRSIPRFDAKSKESTYIYKVALFTATGWRRKESRRLEGTEVMDGSKGLLLKSIEDKSNARLDWLYERIAELDKVERSLTLLMLDGLSYQEIADVMGLSETNVGVKLTRVRKKLTELIGKGNENGL